MRQEPFEHLLKAVCCQLLNLPDYYSILFSARAGVLNLKSAVCSEL